MVSRTDDKMGVARLSWETVNTQYAKRQISTKIQSMSFLNFKAFRALDALNAMKFKKLIDALLTASDAVNVTSLKSSYHCLHKICFNTLNLRCTYVSIFYFKKKIKTFPPLASRDIIILWRHLFMTRIHFLIQKLF